MYYFPSSDYTCIRAQWTNVSMFIVKNWIMILVSSLLNNCSRVTLKIFENYIIMMISNSPWNGKYFFKDTKKFSGINSYETNMFDPIYNITIGIVRVREVNTNSWTYTIDHHSS